MKKIPTAREYFNEELSGEPLTQESVVEGLIEFAKLHRKAILESVADKVRINYKEDGEITKVRSKRLDVDYLSEVSAKVSINVNKDSILNAYPEDLIR